MYQPFSTAASKMARSLRLKTLIPGGRRSFSDSTFPFANAGKSLLSSVFAGGNKSDISSSEPMLQKHWGGNMRPAMATSKQSPTFSSMKAGVVDDLKPSPPSSALDDDDFEELGPSFRHPVSLGSGLAKEKSKIHLSTQDTKPPTSSFDIESIQARGTHNPQSRRNAHLNFIDEQLKIHSGTNINQLNQTEKQNYAVQQNQSQRVISIDKVPFYISVQNLREAASTYGEVLNLSLERGPDNITSCHVEFKSVESKERLLAAQRITVGNCQLPVRDLYVPEYITFKIGNISLETTEPSIHSMCLSCGAVAGLSRTKEGAVEVVFKVKDNFEAQKILRRLNDVHYDDCRWSANLVPLLQQHPAADASGSQWSVGSQINNQLETFRKQFQMQRIYLEDLDNLHYAILHLRDRPADINSQVRTIAIRKNAHSEGLELVPDRLYHTHWRTRTLEDSYVRGGTRRTEAILEDPLKELEGRDVKT